MKLRLTVLVLAGAFMAAATAGSARAALFFLFEPTTAKPGDLVTVRTANTPAGFALGQRTKPFQRPIRLYLAPNRIAGEIRSRFDTRLSFVGSIVPDGQGRGILRFRAPPLDSDGYAVASWCPGCARYSGGRTFSVMRVDDGIVPRYRRQMLLRLQAAPAAETCPVTAPADGTYGNGLLSTRLRPDGLLIGRSEPDGSISWKLGWLPSRPGGALAVRGERLDTPSPPMRVRSVNWGYSSTGRGSWATAVSFPGEGCWRITGRVRDVSLTYVVKLVRG